MEIGASASLPPKSIRERSTLRLLHAPLIMINFCRPNRRRMPQPRHRPSFPCPHLPAPGRRTRRATSEEQKSVHVRNKQTARMTRFLFDSTEHRTQTDFMLCLIAEKTNFFCAPPSRRLAPALLLTSTTLTGARRPVGPLSASDKWSACS